MKQRRRRNGNPHITETDEICNEHRKLNENGWLERKSNKLHNEKL